MRDTDSNPFNNPIVRLALIAVGLCAFGGGYLVARRGALPFLPPANPANPTAGPTIATFFSPRGGCTQAVVTELNSAMQSVSVQAYSFTSKPIADALIAASRRGVKVTVILDKSNQNEKTEGTQLVAAGVPVYIDAAHSIAHNKVMIIDGRTVITGSFNFTNSAEHQNAENLLILRDNPALAGTYTRNLEAHLGHSSHAEQSTFHENPRDRGNSAKPLF